MMLRMLQGHLHDSNALIHKLNAGLVKARQMVCLSEITIKLLHCFNQILIVDKVKVCQGQVWFNEVDTKQCRTHKKPIDKLNILESPHSTC